MSTSAETSGGIGIEAQSVNIEGDVVGRDKITIQYVVPPLEIKPPPEPIRPPDPVGFTGREIELAYFADKLTSTHLAVITGMPGVGKTSLAAMLARRIHEPGQTFWHESHENEGVNAILWKLAGFLAWHGQDDLWQRLQSAQQTGGRPPLPEVAFDYLFQGLRGHGYLLCFDDFQFIDNDSLLNQFMERLRSALLAGELAIIIASRRVPEFVRTGDFDALAGLSLTDTQLLLAARDLTLSAGLTARLHAHTSGNAQFLTLSIIVLQQAKDAARLIDRLAETDDIERYLMNEVDEHLYAEERAVMGAVAVLCGYSGTRNAIEAILDAGSVQRPLRELSDRYLLLVKDGKAGREYLQHSIVQAFYYNQLGRSERQKMHRRGGRYYETDEPDPLKAARHYAWAGEHAQAIRLATSDVWALINQGQARALSRLLETFTAQQLDMEQWLQVNVARGQVYALFRESKQARESYQVALSQLETMPDTPHRHEFTARVCRGMGDLLRFEAPQEALAWLRRGLSELQGSNDLEEAGLLVDTGMVQMHLGHYPDAQSALEQGLARLPQVPGQLRSSALMTLGMVYFFQGDVERARAHTVQALDMSQQLQDHFQTASILRNMGPIKYAAGDWQGAISDMQHALVLAERLGSEQLKAGLEVNLGAAYINTGDDELAFNHLLNGFNLAHSNNLTRIELIAQIRLADLRIRRREWGAAETSLPAVEQMALDTDAKSELIAIYRVWAEIKLATGEQAAALAYIEKSVNLAEELNEDLDRGESLRVLGQLLLASGQRQQAMKKFEESLLLLNGNDPYESARTRVQLGLMLLSDTSPNQGTILLQESLSIFQALGAKRNQAELEDILRLRLTDKAETGS